MTRKMAMNSSTNWSRRLRVSRSFRDAMMASNADPGPTPLIVWYSQSTPRKQSSANAARSHVEGKAARRFSIEKRHMPQLMNAAVIQGGRNTMCGSNARVRDASVQGRLDSNEPSVPRGLALFIYKTEQCECLEAAVTVRFAVRRRNIFTGHFQAIVFARAIGIDDPASERR